jgi:hypothetical protein
MGESLSEDAADLGLDLHRWRNRWQIDVLQTNECRIVPPSSPVPGVNGKYCDDAGPRNAV